METPTARRFTNGQIWLGLFVVWQLFFMLAANGVDLLQRLGLVAREIEPAIPSKAVGRFTEGGHVLEFLDGVGYLTARWGQLTGQPQGWSLYAPFIRREITFLALELHFDSSQEPVKLLSANEPADPGHFFRVAKSRLHQYEYRIEIALPSYAGKTPEELAEIWRTLIQDRVQRDWRYLLAYAKYRLTGWQKEHPGLPPPREVILSVRVYRIPPPGTEPWMWIGPEERPIARWRPGAPTDGEHLPLEAFDPVTKQFRALQRTD